MRLRECKSHRRAELHDYERAGRRGAQASAAQGESNKLRSQRSFHTRNAEVDDRASEAKQTDLQELGLWGVCPQGARWVDVEDMQVMASVPQRESRLRMGFAFASACMSGAWCVRRPDAKAKSAHASAGVSGAWHGQKSDVGVSALREWGRDIGGVPGVEEIWRCRFRCVRSEAWKGNLWRMAKPMSAVQTVVEGRVVSSSGMSATGCRWYPRVSLRPSAETWVCRFVRRRDQQWPGRILCLDARAVESLGIAAAMRDLGWKLKIWIWVDNLTAKAIARRLG